MHTYILYCDSNFVQQMHSYLRPSLRRLSEVTVAEGLELLLDFVVDLDLEVLLRFLLRDL